MAKPIYAGSYPSRGRSRWRTVFTIIILLHLVAVGVYLVATRKGGEEQPAPPGPSAPSADLPLPAAPAPLPLAPASPDPAAQGAIADARAALDGGQLQAAKTILDKVVAQSSDPEALKLLGEVNIRLLRSPQMMPGKEYYVIQSGDYLQKIAGKFNTTVELIKTMNGLESDTIRLGARLLVFNGNFSIRVSKTANTLDLLSGGKLFKRYPVGTGKFGKTPEVGFSIVDKIVEPPWTRPSDNKQIQYGDPENVLGTRWMALKSDDHPELVGFGIHGTWERDSIGHQSSAGCVRMFNEDVEELFDLVPRKTPVVITD